MGWSATVRLFWVACTLLLTSLVLVQDGVAQDTPATTAAAPDFTTQSLRAELDALTAAEEAEGDAVADLTEEQRTQLRTSLTTAIDGSKTPPAKLRSQAGL